MGMESVLSQPPNRFFGHIFGNTYHGSFKHPMKFHVAIGTHFKAGALRERQGVVTVDDEPSSVISMTRKNGGCA